MGHSDISAFCAIAAAATTAACSLHGEVVCPDKDRSGEMDGVVSFRCHTEPYFFMLDEEDDPWRVEFADARNAPTLFPGCLVKVRGIFPKWSATPRRLSVTYRATGRTRIEFSCDGESRAVAVLPANPSGGRAACGALFVPSGASVIRWKVLSGGKGLELVELKLD